ncbi:hypothetical protein, partial [Enterocloster clostridioformis]|uniref:hypothetical protein n=1 Tax=Enterocloster clostridioformis TaxID=1531 RepID=UPI00321C1EAE
MGNRRRRGGLEAPVCLPPGRSVCRRAGLSAAGPVCRGKWDKRKTGISIMEIPAFCLQKMGVEPTRYYYHTDLNRARLPIPP